MVVLALALTACGDSAPGPLAGTWQVSGFMPIKTTFRSGEQETMGVIESVGYKVDRQSVIVTHKDGLMKGTAVRYTMVNPTTVQAMSLTYRKVAN
jgi:hypothetical protein